MDRFEVVSSFSPQGDQPQAIDKLASAINAGSKFQTLMGVTGSGKTFTMAHTIARVNRPTLVISHNKTLAAQLYEEFKDLFPHNAVGYFVSYYDYYQPEAYIPQRDIYIEKDASRNDDLDRLRLSATSNLVSRTDVLLVASVSCIFGLGSPESYKRIGATDPQGEHDRPRRDAAQADRSAIRPQRHGFQAAARSASAATWSSCTRPTRRFAYRIEFFGDEITAIDTINPLTGEILRSEEQLFIYPAVHYVMPADRVQQAVASIRAELDQQVMHLRGQGKLLEAQRLLARTKYDMEMLQEVGFCSGIENYSRHLDGRQAGREAVHADRLFPQGFSADHR